MSTFCELYVKMQELVEKRREEMSSQVSIVLSLEEWEQMPPAALRWWRWDTESKAMEENDE